jgi:hypothetical protein
LCHMSPTRMYSLHSPFDMRSRHSLHLHDSSNSGVFSGRWKPSQEDRPDNGLPTGTSMRRDSGMFRPEARVSAPSVYNVTGTLTRPLVQATSNARVAEVRVGQVANRVQVITIVSLF